MYSYISPSDRIDTYNLIDDGVILLFIPILNHMILPCVPGASIKRRIGVGVFFLFLAAALSTVVDWQLQHIHSNPVVWQMIPIVFFAVGEALIFVSGSWCYYSE